MTESADTAVLRHDWRADEVQALFALPFADLIYRAQSAHRAHFDANEVQLSTLMSIKTGACPEDCAYCPQSVRFDTGLEREALLPLEQVRDAAQRARAAGATRFCMGAAWRSPKDRDLEKVIDMVQAVKDEGLETCVTLGMLKARQAEKLKAAGLDYYNHNLDTSERFYPEIVTTRSYADRLDTLARVRAAGIRVCAGGILGLGESAADRIDMIVTLANLPEPPESVPINMLIRMPGTKLADADPIDPFDFVRSIALTRILMPRSHVRLTAGRSTMSDELQALCFLAGANSIFVGDTLLTAANPGEDRDAALLRRLGMTAETAG